MFTARYALDIFVNLNFKTSITIFLFVHSPNTDRFTCLNTGRHISGDRQVTDCSSRN